MQEAVPVGEGRMIAVLGTNINEINNIMDLTNINGVCEIANDNAEGQIILSGNKETINFFQTLLKEKKLKQFH